MQYVDELIANCQLALMAKPTRTFVLDDLSELEPVRAGIYKIEEIDGDPVSTFSAMRDFKMNTTRRCPKLNHPSPTIYVGSSTTGMKKRITQHYGDGPAGTYALHLKYWAGSRDFRITIFEYAVAKPVLQIIEDAMSYDLQPAFGKMGGNSK